MGGGIELEDPLIPVVHAEGALFDRGIRQGYRLHKHRGTPLQAYLDLRLTLIQDSFVRLLLRVATGRVLRV